MKTDNSCITWLFLVLTVLISDDAEKRDKLGKEYHLKSYSYDQFPLVLETGECDAFYIATPNNQHRQFAVPALEKGSYIIHEKKTICFA
jgi:predicted dehydrogenase